MASTPPAGSIHALPPTEIRAQALQPATADAVWLRIERVSTDDDPAHGPCPPAGSSFRLGAIERGAYGKDSRDWVGCRIELFGGETEYQGQKTDSVLVRPISPEKAPAASKATPEPKQHRTGGIETSRRSSMSSEMDDDIPFAAEFR
jgi:hypothetical protein